MRDREITFRTRWRERERRYERQSEGMICVSEWEREKICKIVSEQECKYERDSK